MTRFDVPLSARPALIARWLFICAAFILLMVVIGGVTRLTESGLSIVEWKPLSGAIPPLNDAEWQAEFAHYKTSSQFALMNSQMTLDGFKHIFFWEYLHRLIGRLVGIVFGLPLVWFAIKRKIPRALLGRLVLLFILGGAQGGIGWLMVASGLKNRINVEPVMLAAHLTMALLLLAAILWTALDCRDGQRVRLTPFAALAIATLAVQIIFGALTAGLRAGQVSNTWPLMNGYVFPRGVNWGQGLGKALVNDPFLVAFIHRWWAWVAVVMMILLARKVRRINRKASIAVHVAFGTQVLLGIATVLNGVWLPLAALHQLVGVLTLCACVWA
ncbi:MAG: COX15/CtaA family protein, partial [Alphaproteobacteria bacterium]|nr:COX15/CtaA family protein [Alphaproteobacteria bacterium]